MTIKIQDIHTIQEAAQAFIQQIGDARVFAFYGKMGAGKTTFVKAICEALGCQDVITSPTFAIVNEYSINFWPLAFSQMPIANSQQPTAIYHFDFYRIKKLEEVYDMGYEEYFYSGALCFIEWPELIEDILPEDAVRVTIEEQPDGSRLVTY
jgi:ATPase, YjeE family